MAKGRRSTQQPEYTTRVVEPQRNGWQKQGVVTKTMYHAYGLPGRIGDIVDVDPVLYDELVKKGFIKAI